MTNKTHSIIPTLKRSGKLLNRKFFAYLMPTLIMTMALSLGLIVDGIIVGNILGTDAFSAVNLCIPIVFGFSSIYSLFGVGGAILVAHAKGKMDHATANIIYSLSIIGLLTVSILISILGFAFSSNIAWLLSGGSELFPLVNSYFTILVIGSPLLIVIPGAVYFIRTDSQPKLAASILILANVINLCCDLIFIGIFDLGIAGAALATLTGYTISGIFSIRYFTSKSKTLKFVKPKKTDLNYYSDIIASGLPSALYGIAGFIKNISINTLIVNSMGPDGVAMFAVCINLLSMSSIAIGGTAQTLIPIVGCSFGEKDYKGIRAVMKTAVITVSGLCFTLLIIFLLFPIQIAGFFGITDPLILAPLQTTIRIFSFSLPIFGINYILMCYYQTIEQKVFSSAITLSENIVFILPLVYFLQMMFGDQAIWYGFIIAEMLTIILIIIVARILSYRSKVERSKLLLLENENARIFDVTIENTLWDATNISEKMMLFCNTHQIDTLRQNRIGVITEELVTNIVRFGSKNHKQNYIDIRLVLVDNDIILRIRDDGLPFNPVKQINEFGTKDTFGLQLVNSMANDFNYSYVLNFNNTMITL
jgi:Na+-driven multidrug efflux pump/anti-sigma regulatory factor (Ser/Thr protein kinase)